MTGKNNDKEWLSFLLSNFMGEHAPKQIVEKLAAFLLKKEGLQGLVLAEMEERIPPVCMSVEIWESSGDRGISALSSLMMKQPELFIERSKEGMRILEEAWLPKLSFEEAVEIRQYPILFEKKLYGILLLILSKAENLMQEEVFMELLCSGIGAGFACRQSRSNEKLSSYVFDTVLDGMKASIYVSDPNTDSILFMNQTMKEVFGLEHPEGRTCWNILQNGMEERCPFCPVADLKKHKPGHIIQWEETNTVTGRNYNNYDSLIPWIDGRIVHLQQSIDVTELKSANIDELSQLLARRPGREAMEKTLEESRKNNDLITVCMYDLNRLKEVNDHFGHAEGDRMIKTVSSAVRESLKEGEYAFRLSGDEFIIIFSEDQMEVRSRIEKILNQLRQTEARYQIGFCYGLVEISPDNPIPTDEIMLLADERMYEQKRKFHIRLNEQQQKESFRAGNMDSFNYNANLLYSAIVQSTDDYLYVCNMKTGVFRYTQAMVDEFELPGQVIENAAAIWGARVHEKDKRAFLEANQEIADGRTTAHCVEYRAKNRKGEWVWVRCRGHLEYDEAGEPELFAGFIKNLGKKNKFDHLTGLLNKIEFEENIHYMVEQNQNQVFGMMLLDIDDMKHINELYNRTFGDEVIRIISQRLRTLLSEEASVYRLDGDEFGILVRGADEESCSEEMRKLFRRIQTSFENRQEYDGKKFYCTISAGTLLYPQNADNFLDLMKYAEYALEYSKSQGKNRCTFFSKEIISQRARTLEMVKELRESIENNFAGFSLCYQPLTAVENTSLAGAEALARWENDRFGKVSPMEFVPLLEQSGLIIPFGRWVLQTALAAGKPWCMMVPDFELNVNISYLQMREEDFIDIVDQVLEQSQFPPENLVLELTESYFAGENKRVQEVFRALRSKGIRIAMDDFGTGYSTLGLLKAAPADVVKIDKTFVRDVQSSSFDATFIQFIVTLCHNVDIKVCLEGVETEEEFQTVSSMGIDTIQGYYFSRPIPEEEFREKYQL